MRQSTAFFHMTKVTALLFVSALFTILSIFSLGQKLFIVTSSSMEPNLHAGSLLYIQQADTYKTGDVVTFKASHNQVITHRIIDSENGYYLTKGDANIVSDSEIIAEQHILGKQIFSIPVIGNVMLFAQKMLVVLS